MNPETRKLNPETLAQRAPKNIIHSAREFLSSNLIEPGSDAQAISKILDIFGNWESFLRYNFRDRDRDQEIPLSPTQKIAHDVPRVFLGIRSSRSLDHLTLYINQEALEILSSDRIGLKIQENHLEIFPHPSGIKLTRPGGWLAKAARSRPMLRSLGGILDRILWDHWVPVSSNHDILIYPLKGAEK